jgi:hypothetical protein
MSTQRLVILGKVYVYLGWCGSWGLKQIHTCLKCLAALGNIEGGNQVRGYLLRLGFGCHNSDPLSQFK